VTHCACAAKGERDPIAPKMAALLAVVECSYHTISLRIVRLFSNTICLVRSPGAFGGTLSPSHQRRAGLRAEALGYLGLIFCG
jgi:hypothetical protein